MSVEMGRNMAAAVLPVEAKSEHPWDRAARLARELSLALDDLDGRYRAVIVPASKEARPVVFEDLGTLS